MSWCPVLEAYTWPRGDTLHFSYFHHEAVYSCFACSFGVSGIMLHSFRLAKTLKIYSLHAGAVAGYQAALYVNRGANARVIVLANELLCSLLGALVCDTLLTS